MSLKTAVYSLAILLMFLIPIGIRGQVSGETRQWHRITLSFEGPDSSEDAAINPFLDYRLDVRFTGPQGQTYRVPGFYAADGNAAETSATSGNIWQVRFSPDQTGLWTYRASFRTGSDVAVSGDANAGTPVAFDGAEGSFRVSPSDKSLPDNRARGRLAYVGGHYLQWLGDGSYYLKAGSDSPENLLAFGDFDNTANSKDWSPHTADWNSGDPTWKNGKGKGLIGAINYLSEQGMNAFSFLTMNVKGDGKDVWPYRAEAHGSLDGDGGADAANRLRFDVSKLEQWEVVFQHAESKGMYLHFKTQETENDQLLDGGDLGTQRRLYYRELIARFGHHLALNWNIGEENTQTTQQQRDCAAFFAENDPYGHHLVLHTYPNDKQRVYPNLLGDASLFTGASLQNGVSSNHNDVQNWVQRSRDAGKPWVVANDEQGNAQTGVAADASYSGNRGNRDDNRETIRKEVLWGTLTAGGAGVEYYFGYATGETDLTAQDLRSRQSKWEDARRALEFFQQYLPFTRMRSRDELVQGDNFCFAETGETYLIYLKNGGSSRLNLTDSPGVYEVRWFDPRNGGELQYGSVRTVQGGSSPGLGNPPNNTGQDWAVLVTRSGGGDTVSSNCNGGFIERDGLVVIEAESIAANGWSVKSGAEGYTGSGYIAWELGNHLNNPGEGLIEVPIQISTPGTYRFEWRNRVGEGNDATESNDSWLRFDDADDFFGRKADGSIVYPKGRGLQPEPNGSGADGWFKVYSSGALDWKWSTRTSDNDAHDIFVTFDQPGTYTMEISARSEHHWIDRIILHREVEAPRSLALPETACTASDIREKVIRVAPNPVGRGELLEFFDLPAGTYQLTGFSLSGRRVYQETVEVSGAFTLDSTGLPPGLLIFAFENLKNVYTAKVLVR